MIELTHVNQGTHELRVMCVYLRLTFVVRLGCEICMQDFAANKAAMGSWKQPDKSKCCQAAR